VLAVRLTRGYFRTARRHAAPGTMTARQVALALRGMSEEPVPADDDVEDLIPPVLTCWARRVAGTSLAILFVRRADEVLVLAVRTWA
jgi:hypothetical protein